MSSCKRFVAFDLGATSGRTILGELSDDGRLKIEELSRFPNRMVEVGGHLHWDIYALFEHIKDGLKIVARLGIVPDSIGIDTWGVDFGCLAEDGTIIGLPRAYRDESNNGADTRFFESVMSPHDLYAITGIQHLGFNTLFQLYEQRGSFPLRNADKIVFLPDLLCYLLTGKIVTEYTIASTGSLLDARSGKMDEALLSRLGIDGKKFGRMVLPGTIVGRLSEDVARETGLPPVPVTAVAGHDTASAIAAIPAEGDGWAYLSSGTWSLMGIETAAPVINETARCNNITNEGGVFGTIRLLKNITGMWLLEQCLQSWKASGMEYSYPELVSMARDARQFVCMLDPDAPMFRCPDDMPAAIDRYCLQTNQQPPVTHGEYVRAIFESLALKYRMTLDVFKSLSTVEIDRLHIIGGGSRNELLNDFTAGATGMAVYAGPCECSALGNILLQATAVGAIGSLQEMRDVVRRNFEPTPYLPTDTDIWNKAYDNYQQLLKSQIP